MTGATAEALAKTLNTLIREGWGDVDDVLKARRQLEREIMNTGVPRINAEIVSEAHEALIRAIVAESIADIKATVPDQASDSSKAQGEAAPESYEII